MTGSRIDTLLIHGLIDGLLGLAVLVAWIGALGFLRLRDVLDRLHCAAFTNAGVGVLLTSTAFLSDGASDRALKMALLTVIALVGGAAASHAIGRALVARGDVPDALQPAGLPPPTDPQRADPERG